METYEYMIQRNSILKLEELNYLGSMGWSLAGIIQYEEDCDYIFQRLIPEEPEFEDPKLLSEIIRVVKDANAI